MQQSQKHRNEKREKSLSRFYYYSLLPKSYLVLTSLSFSRGAAIVSLLVSDADFAAALDGRLRLHAAALVVGNWAAHRRQAANSDKHRGCDVRR